jgi:hypothetical protein
VPGRSRGRARDAAIALAVGGKYDETVDRDSAHERLRAKAEQSRAAAEAEKQRKA